MGRIRKMIEEIILESGQPIDYVQRYDGVYTPWYETDFEYFVRKQKERIKNFFKRIF